VGGYFIGCTRSGRSVGTRRRRGSRGVNVGRPRWIYEGNIGVMEATTRVAVRTPYAYTRICGDQKERERERERRIAPRGNIRPSISEIRRWINRSFAPSRACDFESLASILSKGGKRESLRRIILRTPFAVASPANVSSADSAARSSTVIGPFKNLTALRSVYLYASAYTKSDELTFSFA